MLNDGNTIAEEWANEVALKSCRLIDAYSNYSITEICIGREGLLGVHRGQSITSSVIDTFKKRLCTRWKRGIYA